METIKCTTITSDVKLREAIATELQEISNVLLTRGLPGDSSLDAAFRFFRASTARIVFLDVRGGAEALQISAEMELRDPGLQFIALGEAPEADLPWRGIQEHLMLPFDPIALRMAVARRIKVLEKLPRALRNPTAFMAFLPAKAGAGASTLAAGLAEILSANHKVLLCDLDLVSGTLAFRYRLERNFSMKELLDNVPKLDEAMWMRMVSDAKEVDNMHVLPSTLGEGDLREDRIPEWISFLRTIYDVVIFDLSGSLESYAIEVMRSCGQIFLVSNQEPECLHLGRNKMQVLRRNELDDRTSVMLNRTVKEHTLQRAEICELLDVSVKAEFPNDYWAVQNCQLAGKPLDPNSALGKALQQKVPDILETAKQLKTKQHRFIEYVKLPIRRYWHRDEMRLES